MDEQTLLILAIVIFCASPFFAILVLALLVKITKPLRKQLRASKKFDSIKGDGDAKNARLQEWVQVHEYNIYIHKVTERLYTRNQKTERIISIEVEYKNQNAQGILNCRRNQWHLLSQDGYSYEAESSMVFNRNRTYFGSERFVSPGRNARGWFAFIVPGDAKITTLQFMTAFLKTGIADIDIENAIEQDEPVGESKTGNNNPGSTLQEESARIDKATFEFMGILPDKDIKRTISLAAGLAGLKMLRAANIDLGKHEPGHLLAGAVPKETFDELQSFILPQVQLNGLDPSGMGKDQPPNENKDYVAEITQYEPGLDAICRQKGLQEKQYTFVAAWAALKLVLAGKKMGLVEPKVGLAIMMHHIVLGSKTVPFPQPIP